MNAEGGNSFRNFFDENEDERDESAKACVDRDPRDFTVHRSSYKAPSTSGFFQRANEPKGSGAREKKKEQLHSRREMARLKCGERAQWRRENDSISVCMIIAPLHLQSPVNCVLSEGLHYS